MGQQRRSAKTLGDALKMRLNTVNLRGLKEHRYSEDILTV